MTSSVRTRRAPAWSGALLASLLGAPVLAQIQAPAPTKTVEADPAPKAGADNVDAPVTVASDTRTGEASKAPPAPGQRKLPCGCAKPRLLREGRLMPLGDGKAVAAWVNTSPTNGTRMHAFAADFFDRRASAAEDAQIPIAAAALDDIAGLTPSEHVLERVHLAGPYDAPFYLGMLRPNDSVPKDVVKVDPSGEPGSAEPMPPRTEHLWLDLMETVERAACGAPFTTTRVAWQEAEVSPRVVGFLAEWVGDDGARATAVVDARHAQTFGLGRVEACDHGLPIPEGKAGTMRLSPLSSSFGRGPTWEFLVSAEGGVPERFRRPDGLPPEIDNPFTTGELGDRPGIDDRSDKTALGVMLGVVGMAATLAGLLWPLLRRRRKVATVVCPACKAEHELDLLDPATDGMFCPSCGKSSIYVSLEADGEPRATVMVLDGTTVKVADVAPPSTSGDKAAPTAPRTDDEKPNA